MTPGARSERQWRPRGQEGGVNPTFITVGGGRDQRLDVRHRVDDTCSCWTAFYAPLPGKVQRSYPLRLRVF